jgi:hypothetical protein
MARVLALLNPYFDKDTPQAIREIEAEDWASALSAYPYWAIEKAARWWKSDENPDRRKRPLEGDLVARTKREMDAVSAAKIKLASDKIRRAKTSNGHSAPKPRWPRCVSAWQGSAMKRWPRCGRGWVWKKYDPRAIWA